MSAAPAPVGADITALSPRTTRVITTLVLASFVGLGFSTMMLGPSIDTFARRADVTKGKAGILFTFGAVGYLLGSLFAGRLLAKMRAAKVIAAGLVIMVGCLLGCAFVSSLLVVGLLQAVLGLGGALVDVTGNSTILWVHKGGSVMNALHLCFSIGGIFGPIAVARSLDWDHNDIRGAYIVVAAILGVLALVAMRVDSPSNPHTAEGKVRLTAPQVRLLALGVVFFLFYVGVEMGFAGWVVDYGVERGLSRTGGATALATGFLGAFAAGRLLSVPIGRRLKPLQTLWIDIVLCLGALAVMIVGSGRISMWTGTVLFGLGTASMFPSFMSLTEPVLPSTGAVTGSFLAGAGAGGMIIPPLIGALLTSRGAKAMPIVVGIGTVVCGVVVFAFVNLAKSAAPANAGASSTASA